MSEPLWSDRRIYDEAVLRVREQKHWAGAIKVATTIRDDYEEQLANQYQRIERFVELVNQLEAQLAERWQPVAANFILTHDTGLVDTPKQFVRWNADDESIITGEDDGNFYHCPLPDNIRLCRLVTQEPTL